MINYIDYEDLWTTFETTRDGMTTRNVEVLTGYFKAPATTKYRFYLACDDKCQLYLGNSLEPTDLMNEGDPIASRSRWGRFRNYDRDCDT